MFLLSISIWNQSVLDVRMNFERYTYSETKQLKKGIWQETLIHVIEFLNDAWMHYRCKMWLLKISPDVFPKLEVRNEKF